MGWRIMIAGRFGVVGVLAQSSLISTSTSRLEILRLTFLQQNGTFREHAPKGAHHSNGVSIDCMNRVFQPIKVERKWRI